MEAIRAILVLIGCCGFSVLFGFILAVIDLKGENKK